MAFQIYFVIIPWNSIKTIFLLIIVIQIEISSEKFPWEHIDTFHTNNLFDLYSNKSRINIFF